MSAILGKIWALITSGGWKTLTGAIVWGLAHVGLITTILGIFGIPGAAIASVAALVGQALIVIGLAHKVNRFDFGAFIAAIVAALKSYTDALPPTKT